MTPDAAFALELAVVAVLVVLIVAIVVTCEPATVGAGRAATAAVHYDVERALGADTLVTCAQAKAAAAAGRGSGGGGGTAGKSCAICLSDYAAAGDELVRVLPACGHFFHAECGIDGWLRKGGTCPVCRGRRGPSALRCRRERQGAPRLARHSGRISFSSCFHC